MATSDIEICNMALDKLNQENITSLDENTKSAKKCKLWYDTIRKSLLMNLNATFSIDRAILAEVKDFVPVYGYEKAFALPPDCLQVLNLGSPLEDRLKQIEGEYFYCDESIKRVEIRYIKDVTDATLFDAEFALLFAYALAEEICVPLTEDIQKANWLRGLVKEKYVECSTKYGRDNPVTVINRPRYREARFFPEILDTNHFLR